MTLDELKNVFDRTLERLRQQGLGDRELYAVRIADHRQGHGRCIYSAAYWLNGGGPVCIEFEEATCARSDTSD